MVDVRSPCFLELATSSKVALLGSEEVSVQWRVRGKVSQSEAEDRT